MSVARANQSETLAPKDGADHLASLRDGRTILLDGERVSNFTDHSAYRNAVRSFSRLYDLQHHEKDQLTFVSPSSSRQVNLAWMLPRTHEELRAKRNAIERWAQVSGGMLGRSPDHVANALAGMVIGIDAFRQHAGGRADALLRYYEHARDNDLAISYVIVNPQANRGAATSRQDEGLVARVVARNSDSVTIRGAKMLGTGTVMSNELLVGNIAPLQPGEEPYAFSAAVPIASRGLSILSRRSYEQSVTSVFDHPLASRFDENDALIYFDDVEVPLERIFVLDDVAMARAQFHDTAAQRYMGWQSMVRLSVKMRFLLGLIRRVVEVNAVAAAPEIQLRLGQLAAQVTMVDAFVAAMEARATRVGDYLVPDRASVHGAQVLTQEMYPLFVNLLRDLAGGGVIMLPSSVQDLLSPATARLVQLTQRSARVDAVGRVKLLRLVWDAIGSEFGSRHTQYEMFYSGSTMVTRGNAFRSFDWARGEAMIEEFLAGYALPSAQTQP